MKGIFETSTTGSTAATADIVALLLGTLALRLESAGELATTAFPEFVLS
jgi:hypothetical protein